MRQPVKGVSSRSLAVALHRLVNASESQVLWIMDGVVVELEALDGRLGFKVWKNNIYKIRIRKSSMRRSSFELILKD